MTKLVTMENFQMNKVAVILETRYTDYIFRNKRLEEK